MVESPTKAAALQSYLDGDWKVVATKGHIKDLPPKQYGIDFTNDFEPSYEWLKGKKTLFSNIRKLSKSSSHVYIASDPDREGEMIAEHISDELGDKKGNMFRIRLKEISKQEVISALKNPSVIDRQLVDSQVARRVIDRIFGFEISPFLWKYLGGSSLSAGRVQSTVLRWICEREAEIRNFIPEVYVSLKAKVSDKKENFELDYVLPKSKEKLNEKEAKSVLSKYGVSGKGKALPDTFLTLESIEEKEYKNYPPPPFTTAVLQETASRVFGFSGSHTMKIAQVLFEGKRMKNGEYQGLITYMRTDSTHVTDGKKKIALRFLNDKSPDLIRGVPTKGKEKLHSQGAHEAILPIDPYLTPDSLRSSLKPDEFKLYELIWQRFLESFLLPETGIERNYIFESEGERWNTKEKEGKSLGFKGFLGKEKLPADPRKGLKPGAKVSVSEWIWEDKKTSPPSRYTEGSLIQKMEKTGVGRPSTYSQTLVTLMKRKYVFQNQKKIGASALGEKVNDLLVERFDEIVGESFTKSMEEELDLLAGGQGARVKLIRSFYQRVLELKKLKPTLKKEKTKDKGKSIPQKGTRVCPTCNEGKVLAKFSKTGKTIYFCSRYPHCDYASYEE
ncbi:type I DNA topoisomerase [Leptospira kobayashii]|nr:type I DNA topoisomerase [Leptospira kobayashii]